MPDIRQFIFAGAGGIVQGCNKVSHINEVWADYSTMTRLRN